MYKHSLRFLTMLICCHAGAAFGGCGDDAAAMRYLRGIDAMDWSTMRALLAGDARYTDPTMSHYDRPPIELRGADDIVDFWRTSSAESGTSEIDYRITGCFETAGYSIVNMDIRISVAGAYWDVAKDTIVIPGKVLSIIRVVDDRIAEHHDYVDYAEADRIVAALQSKYGRATPGN
ncbi:MAG: nuclear transport factor 2 family protein [Pseudomonadota bacterium]